MTIKQELLNQIATEFKKKKLKLALAESCTGGGLSYWLTSIAGSSDYFECGWVTYSNASKKELLDVKESTLKTHGAVSEETAKEMALGALRKSIADIALSITGIAGPDGGTATKPVGTVWIGWMKKNHPPEAQGFLFKGDRQAVRDASINQSLELLLDLLKTLS